MPEKIHTWLVDTREPQDNHWFIGSTKWHCRRQMLKAGDYTIEGYEDYFTIERKADDLVKSLIHEMPRFQEALGRMTLLPYKLILVEHPLSYFVNKQYEEDVEPQQVLGAIHEIFLTKGIPTIFASDRMNAMWYAATFAQSVMKKVDVRARRIRKR